MKHIIIIIAATAILLGATMFFGILRNAPRITTPQVSVPSAITAPFAPQTDTQGGVIVTVIPKNLAPGAASWDFEITLTTHSVELDEDMSAVSMLVDDSGKEYPPRAWKGSPSGGHHREGVLTFAPISPLPRSLTLKIRAIGNNDERNFRWIIR